MPIDEHQYFVEKVFVLNRLYEALNIPKNPIEEMQKYWKEFKMREGSLWHKDGHYESLRIDRHQRCFVKCLNDVVSDIARDRK